VAMAWDAAGGSLRTLKTGSHSQVGPSSHIPPRSTSRFGSVGELYLALVQVLCVIGLDSVLNWRLPKKEPNEFLAHDTSFWHYMELVQ
jgi:hypothetical protein